MINLKRLSFIAISLFLSLSSLLGATKIMPLGDSITGSPGCWRAFLWQSLQNAGYTNIDFVGTQPPQGCAVPYDGENEGHGGILATNMADQNQLPPWLNATNPDIVLMHLGTNDVWSNRSLTVLLNAFTKLVGQMRANNPNMKILVAKIIPMDPTRSCTECDDRVINLNNALPAWASGLSTPQSPITVVDLWTGFDYTADTYDGVHPSESGDRKMAAGWFPALTALLNGGPMPTPTPGFNPGDVNSDGTVNIIDALMIAQFYVGLTVPQFNAAAADVSGDGAITIVDALQVAQCYVGLISCSF